MADNPHSVISLMCGRDGVDCLMDDITYMNAVQK